MLDLISELRQKLSLCAATLTSSERKNGRLNLLEEDTMALPSMQQGFPNQQASEAIWGTALQ